MTESSTNYGLSKILLAGGVVIFAIGQSLLFIVVAPMARSIGFTEFEFGIAFSLANVSLIFAGPFWGKKSDAIGRKPVFIIGLFGSAVGTAAMALTLRYGMDLKEAGVTAGFGLLALVFASRVIYGLTASAIYPSSSGYMADVTGWNDRAKGMALIGSANALGSILGPAIGGGLAFLGVLFPMWAAVGLSIVAAFIAIAWLVEPEQHKIRKANKDPAKPALKFTDPRLVPYMILWAAFFIIFISLNFVTAFYIQDQYNITQIDDVMRVASIMLACMAVVITLVQGVLFQIIKLEPHLLMLIAGPSFALAVFTIAFAPNLIALGIGFAILGGSFACATPGINGSASLKMEAHEQGTAAGYLAAANTSGAILGPVVGAGLYNIQPNAPMLAGGVLMLFISVYAFTIEKPVQAQP
ncbi:MAG: MFS transporter [Gammaproteobacteria bacterium]|nr:MFS transporter [Gammaproteobacteria bacterium]